MSLSHRPRTRPAPGLIVGAVVLVAVLLVLAIVAATGTDIRGSIQGAVDSLFPPSAATLQGQDIRDLYNIVFFFAAAIFIAVEVLIVWTVVRYRQRDDDEDLPAQTHGNNLAEILWTVIPTVIVAFLFFISWQTLNKVEAASPDPGLQVRAIAGQFQWTFEYLADDGETVEYKQLTPTGDNGGLFVPVGTPIRVQLESPDVIHAFYVPRFLFKKDVVPGQTNVFQFDVKPEEAGQTFRGQCAELCGAGHRIMTFDVHALSQADFDTWLADARAAAEPSGGPGATVPPNATTLPVTAVNIEFDKKQLEAPANQPFGIALTNEDAAGTLHDVDIRTADGETLQDQQPIDGGEQTTYVYQPLEAGEYTYICSIHPVPAMTGTLTVK